jgi:hypothetical protein
LKAGRDELMSSNSWSWLQCLASTQPKQSGLLGATFKLAAVRAAAEVIIHKKKRTPANALIYPFWCAPTVPQQEFARVTKRKALEIDLRFQGLIGCGSQI